MDEAGIDHEKLTIEITESIVGQDFDYMKAQIIRFRDLGFKVWIDDFGSGYSSLDMLQSIEFDLIKLDMRFMQRFEEGDESKIILTELIKMAIGLGIDTVTEGVETREQMEFLKEVGCTKLQGFHYCKPIPQSEIYKRNELGIQIGFENPDESAYYEAIGRINLYDLTVVANEDPDTYQNYFDTFPMAILETDDAKTTIVRCNKSYREFTNRVFGRAAEGATLEEAAFTPGTPGAAFVGAIEQCAKDGRRIVIDDQLADGTALHAFVRRIAVNPVTGVVACAVVVLGITEERSVGTTYARVAQALSADYFSLFYVDLETERFIEYSSEAASEELSIERHDTDFFGKARADALKYLHEDDQQAFVEAFTKENVVRSLEENGTFTQTYRQIIDGKPVYISMKAVRMGAGDSHIIVGVSNVDEQMRQREALERIKEERITFSRIAALSGDYICIYTVDPKTDRFTEYSATSDYQAIGLLKEGEDFFGVSRSESLRTIHPDDLDMFDKAFTKENVLREIEENGLFAETHRLFIEGVPRYICLKAALVEEKDGQQLIVGVTDVDAQVRREKKLERDLSAARAMANVDSLTGVKNKNAYSHLEEQINASIAEGDTPEFAIVICDVNGLKDINDTHGHQMGDRYLKDGCSIICTVFKRSPVFRIGGDEFAIVARGRDYERVHELVEELSEGNITRLEEGGVVIACGVAKYNGEPNVAAVFDLADAKMYENKKALKSLGE